ncbi:MAG: hypothetical protein M9962_11245 [Oligoflexia bacterium]|nr:hypothetical protein [Oligoflexia bacterium]
MSKRPKWEAKNTRRRFTRVTKTELQLKLESILEILHIGGGGLASSAKILVQEASDTRCLPKRRKDV